VGTDDKMPSEKPVHALPGTHELVVATAVRHASAGRRALDLGAGSGALAERLQEAGFDVTAADVENYFELDSEFLQIDLNDTAFDRLLRPGFDLITSVEVIEHLENPTGFLRCIERLLKPDGVAIITSPNVENVAARIRYFLNGDIRAMDKTAPNHITPIHRDLFLRQTAPRAGLRVVERCEYPRGDFPLTGRRYFVPLFWAVMPFMKGPALTGDSNVFVLKKP
jgi:SAM-dependent methyltransferase